MAQNLVQDAINDAEREIQTRTRERGAMQARLREVAALESIADELTRLRCLLVAYANAVAPA
jgi:hypothetical protein